MKVEVDSEVIAEIRNALQVILSNTEITLRNADCLPIGGVRLIKITKKVHKIDSLLPQVEFEGGKK